MSSITPGIRTRLLIISDTHGRQPFDPATNPEEARRYAFRRPLPKADVAIHCGDLTTISDVKEYQATFDMMREVDASLKVVIPGNHDCSMDVNFWEENVSFAYFSPGSFFLFPYRAKTRHSNISLPETLITFDHSAHGGASCHHRC